MKNLLARFQFTRSRKPRKGRGGPSRTNFWRFAGLFWLAIVPGVFGAEPPPDPSQTEEFVRWSTVVPRPTQARGDAEFWTVAPEVLVDWGPVTGAERQSLSGRMDRMWGPLGRTWRPAQDHENATLSFSSEGPVGEAYSLIVTPRGSLVQASEPAGRFYALVTLTQLLPPSVRPGDLVRVTTGSITDNPRFVWRGLMLDSSRHYQSPETLEWILELMALHKLNRFHWHLTDDQGWRLPVEGWPRLAEFGSQRMEANGKLYGRAYTVAEIRHLVAFASERHIVVVPEIDLPGHSSAALAAYPELSATGLPRQVPLEWGVADGVLSLGRKSVDRFTQDVLATLVSLFPGPWIHWGGDEVYRTPWMRNAESLAWMRSRKVTSADQALALFWSDLAQKTLDTGKIPLGWDDVALFSPPRDTLIQWWDDPARALKALKAGYSLIASWKEASYLDYPEIAGDGDRAFWMPVQTLDTVANHPIWPPGTPASLRSQVIGLEAGLWTERAPEPTLGRKLFPRLSLLAELAWGGPDRAPGWARRIEAHRERLVNWGVGMPPPAR